MSWGLAALAVSVVRQDGMRGRLSGWAWARWLARW
jgi:hypothetical protein